MEDRRRVKRGLTHDSGCKCHIRVPEPPVLAFPVNMCTCLYWGRGQQTDVAGLRFPAAWSGTGTVQRGSISIAQAQY